MSILTQAKKNKAWSLTILTLLVIVSIGLTNITAFSPQPEEETAPAGPPPAMPVEVETLQAEPLRLWTEFSGRIEAVERVAVRPRVGGAIQAVLFEEGTTVDKGDALFIIDPRPYEADLASAEASLASTLARAKLAEDELKRLEQLVEKRAVSRSLYDAAVSDHKVAVANIGTAQAMVRQAKLNLDYAHIDAPIKGLVSRAEITEGNVIEAGPNAPVLTTIVANDQVYAEFDVDEQTYINIIRNNKDKALPVELELTAESSVVYRGVIHAFDNRLDTSSGTIRARAIFANVDGVLVPGMYTNVRLGSPDEEERLLVSERVIGTNQNKRYVYTVSAEQTVAYREVELGASVDGKRVVVSGLEAGDRIIVNNLQKLQPGMPVQPTQRQSQQESGTLARL